MRLPHFFAFLHHNERNSKTGTMGTMGTMGGRNTMSKFLLLSPFLFLSESPFSVH